MSKHLSLRLTLIISVVVPLVLAVGSVGYLALRVLEDWAEAGLQQEVALVARAVRLPLGHALELDRQGSVEQVLASVFRINRVYSAYVYDAHGRTIAAVGTGGSVASRQRMSRIAAEGARRGEYGEIAGREVYSYFVPVNDSGGQIVGLLQVTRRRSDIRSQVAALRAQPIGLLALSLLAVIALVLYGHHGAIGRYLTRLGRSMERVRTGDRGYRAAVEGPREIASLGSTLNSMLDSIDRAEREIEERRAVQDSLEERLLQSEKLAAIGRLAAGVAHEVGTPLSVIAGKAQRAGRREELPEATQTTLLEIRAEVRRMEHIVRQLLDFGRRTGLHRRRVAADQLAEASAAAVREEVPRAGAAVRIGGPSPAPEINADPIQIEQVLVNLLRNALQAAPQGEVRLEWFAREGEVGFTVDDNGPGAPAGVRPHLYEPFFTTKSVGEGTGLGLAVAHGIVERHGGSIEVADSPLGGARFRVSLPRDHEDDKSIP